MIVQPYEPPTVVDYGQIDDCTFGRPGRRIRRRRGWRRQDDDWEEDEGLSGFPT